MGSDQTRGPGPRDTANYVFDNAAEHTHARLKALSGIFDPETIPHLSERGIEKGWHCIEVGGRRHCQFFGRLGGARCVPGETCRSRRGRSAR